MRRLYFLMAFFCAMAARTVFAADGEVLKVLPQFLDAQGRHALSPSLYERDAYQAYLRKHPLERAALLIEVQWKARDVNWSKLTLRAEVRGVLGNSLTNMTFEIPAKKSGWFSNWSDFKIEGGDFKNFGELAAWRVTLWDDGKQIGAQQSFMWSPVGQTNKIAK